jgi:hypothetical protein
MVRRKKRHGKILFSRDHHLTMTCLGFVCLGKHIFE